MTIKDLFPEEPTRIDHAMSHTCRKLAEMVDDLGDLLDRECRRSKYLDDLLGTIGARAELHTSTYDGSKYISLGYIGEKNPMFEELVKYFNLREEDDKCEDTN